MNHCEHDQQMMNNVVCRVNSLLAFQLLLSVSMVVRGGLYTTIFIGDGLEGEHKKDTIEEGGIFLLGL